MQIRQESLVYILTHDNDIINWFHICDGLGAKLSRSQGLEMKLAGTDLETLLIGNLTPRLRNANIQGEPGISSSHDSDIIKKSQTEAYTLYTLYTLNTRCVGYLPLTI